MGKDMSMEFVSETTRRGGRAYSPSESGSDYPYPPQVRPGMINTPSSDAGSYAQMAMAGGMRGGPGMMRGPGMDDSDSDSDSGMIGMPQGMGISQRQISASTQASSRTPLTTSRPASAEATEMPFTLSEPSEVQGTPILSVRFDQEVCYIV